MFFLIDQSKKIVFGWSPKSGCTHIKKIYHYLTKSINTHSVHLNSDYKNELPADMHNYTTIIVIRNPYERLVSGFLDRYRPTNNTRNMKWKAKVITFELFVNELIKENWVAIDKHHFSSQLSDKFSERILNSKELYVYDLNNIDYEFIGNLYNTQIPREIIEYRGNHVRRQTVMYEEPVYNLDMPVYFNYKVPVHYFYNEEIKSKVYNYFKKDFEFFKSVGFDYAIIMPIATLKNTISS